MSSESNIQLSSLNGIKNVYFVGIGGIGMSAIARYFLSKGIKVSGYDRTSTELTKELEAEGISIHYDEDVNGIPKDVDLVVYTPAVPKDHAEMAYYQQNGYKVVKRSDALQAISADSFNICIAGTHGKTTTSTMISHILRHSGYGCNAFLGGISVNYGTNFWSNPNNVCVIEADEYDRSFLKLSPDVAVITSMDADHLDIYGDEKNMQDAFVAFGNKLRKGGLLVSKFGLKRVKEIRADKKMSYSLQNDAADVFASNIKIEEGGYVFDVKLKDTVLSNVELRIGGMHNVENVLVAIAVAHSLEIDDEKIKVAVADFKGVKRRFEYVLPPKKKVETGDDRHPCTQLFNQVHFVGRTVDIKRGTVGCKNSCYGFSFRNRNMQSVLAVEIEFCIPDPRIFLQRFFQFAEIDTCNWLVDQRTSSCFLDQIKNIFLFYVKFFSRSFNADQHLAANMFFLPPVSCYQQSGHPAYYQQP